MIACAKTRTKILCMLCDIPAELQEEHNGHGRRTGKKQPAGPPAPFHGGGSYSVCTVCYNVFKNMKTLTRHMYRFHGQPVQF